MDVPIKTIENAVQAVKDGSLGEAFATAAAFVAVGQVVVDAHPEGPGNVSPDLLDFITTVVNTAEALVAAS